MPIHLHEMIERHRSTGQPTGKVAVTDGADGFTYEDVAGGPEVPFDHGNMGATETLDFATDGTWHRGNLDVACAITVTGFTVDEGLVCLVELTGTGAITWDADVDFGGGDDQPNASGYTAFVLFSSAGDADIKGAKVGGGSPIEVLDEGVSLTTGVTSLDFVGAGVTATAVGDAVTVTIPGGSDPSADTHVWMPLTSVDGGEPVLVWDGDDSLIPDLVPV